LEQKCPAAAAATAAAAAAATHCNVPVHRRVREYYALSPSAMDRPSNASNLRLLLLFNGNTLRCAMPGIEALNGAGRSAVTKDRNRRSATYVISIRCY